MAHKRILMPSQFVSGDELTADMVAIGMRFATNPASKEPNIEDTIVAASIEGIEQEDYRVLSLLVDWFDIHFERVNVDRLSKMVQQLSNKKVKAFWSALAHWKRQDWRLKKLENLYKKPAIELIDEGTNFQIAKYGEDERFVNSVLRVPAKLFRHRLSDIMTPTELAKRHRAYHYRIEIGPSYRADMWALIEQNSNLTPAEIARKTYGSFPTAWEVKHDWMILHQERMLVAV